MTFHQKDAINVYYDTVSTPYGDCIVMATQKGICWTSTPGSSLEKAQAWAKKYLAVDEVTQNSDFPILKKAVEELKHYFAGEKVTFSGPFDFYGAPFHQKVWLELAHIPYGEIATYGQIAARVGNPKASRAVGSANNKNPIAIMIPCHRVVGSTGKLVGYAGGMKTKEWLLQLEKNKE